MISIPIIDVFAGPGGLGEGFSSLRTEDGGRVFDIRLSIEKDEYAHKTLRLRSFYRQFYIDEVPDLYYDYIKENNPEKKKEIFDELRKKYNKQWEKAEREAWHFELPYPEETNKKGVKKGGYTLKEIVQKNYEIDRRISEALCNHKEFVLIGGPPCQAYSLVGRSRNQGISSTDHRVHLYKEYLRIIAKHHPAVFVMENVKGLLSANVEGHKVFNLIKEDLENPSKVFPDCNSPKYKVFSFVKMPDCFDADGFPIYNNNNDFLIKSETYKIPQRRHRVILLGIRNDLTNFSFPLLKKERDETTLSEVIGSLPKIRSGIGREIAGTNGAGKHMYRNITNSYTNWSESIKEFYKRIAEELNIKIDDTGIVEDNQGSNFIETELKDFRDQYYENWYSDKRLNGVLNHESRTHLREDLGRYLFSSLYLKSTGEFPRLKNYPEWLLPKHKNASKGDKFVDRFRTQIPEQAATTITSHISKDGHYFIHYDPSQCRSLTVREAARIQTFPDNYYFCGSQTQQYQQVGNAVPPLLARQLAEIVFNIYKNEFQANNK